MENEFWNRKSAKYTKTISAPDVLKYIFVYNKNIALIKGRLDFFLLLLVINIAGIGSGS